MTSRHADWGAAWPATWRERLANGLARLVGLMLLPALVAWARVAEGKRRRG